MAQTINNTSVNNEIKTPTLVVPTSSKGGHAAKEATSVILMLETLNELREELSQANETELEEGGTDFNQPVASRDQQEEKHGDDSSSSKGASHTHNNGPFSQLSMSRTALAIVATLKNFAMLLLTIMLENEQNKIAAQSSGDAAAANALQLQQKGENQYIGAFYAGLGQMVGAGIGFAAQYYTTSPEKANAAEMETMQNQKTSLENLKIAINTPARNGGGVVGEGLPEIPAGVSPDVVAQLKAGQFLNDNDNQPRMVEGLYNPVGEVGNPIVPIPTRIQDVMEAVSIDDPASADQIKAALDKKIDNLTMALNTKAQNISIYSGQRQAFSGLGNSLAQGVGGIMQGKYQADVATNEMNSAIQTQINQQATAMVQTDQGQISNTFNLVGQALSTLGQISTSANQ